MMKNLLFMVALMATTFVMAQDALTFQTPDDTYNASTTLSFNIVYTSSVDLPADSFEFHLWSISVPWSQGWRASTTNTTPLPAGANMVATMEIGSLPGDILNGSGNLMTDAELLAADPNAHGSATDYYYELRGIVSSVATNAGFTGSDPNTSFIHISPSLSTKETSLESINILPNPTSGTISLSTKNGDITSVKIFDIAGKEVKSFNSVGNMDVSNLSKGLYLLRTNLGTVSKFVKI